jgi:hypothetical protein
MVISRTHSVYQRTAAIDSQMPLPMQRARSTMILMLDLPASRRSRPDQAARGSASSLPKED